MNTQAKKTVASTAKLASDAANKAAKNAYGAVEHTRNQAENVVKIGGNAVKEFLATSTGEAQKAQEKAFAIGREGAEHFAKSADAVTKALYDGIGMSRDNVETCIECGNMAAALVKDVSTEVFEYANKAFSDNVELSKEFFTCRTINDMFELQNRASKSLIDNFFNQSVKLSGMVFEYATEALEPINERVSHATEQFSKSLAA
jgi:hypothetical protein